jgi:hypothetical protein
LKYTDFTNLKELEISAGGGTNVTVTQEVLVERNIGS